MNERTKDHPITLCDIIRPDGALDRGLRVFCSRRSQSVDLDTCRACARLVQVCDDASGSVASVRCSPGTASTLDPAEVAVGALIAGQVSAVRNDVPEHTIRALFVK